MNLIELLDKAKQIANIETDYALAKVLGIDRRIISDWKKGKRHPSNEEAVKLATLAKMPEMQVIAMIELRTANSEQKRKFWEHYIESRGIAACLTMTALAASIVLAPEPAEASVLHLANYDANFLRLEQNPNIHYAYFRDGQSGTVRGIVSRLTYQRLAVFPSPALPTAARRYEHGKAATWSKLHVYWPESPGPM